MEPEKDDDIKKPDEIASHLATQEPDVAETGTVYPPKFMPEAKQEHVWLRSLISLTFYLILGFYFFRRWELLLLITAIVFLHEMGHFLAMKFFRYNDLGIFFIPLLGAYVSGTKREVSQRESSVILLAGPLPGMILGIAGYLFWKQNPGLELAGISLYTISILLIILNLFNLFPIYPLDGGQLLNRVFLNEHNWLSKAFILVSIGLLSWFAWKSNFPVLFLFPAMMIFRLFSETKLTSIEKRIEESGINTEVEYKDLPDADYWAIRKILAEEHPAFRDIDAGPPYEYSYKEEKVMNMVQSLLHRTLLQDMTLTAKFLVFVIWIAGIATPWLLNMDLSFFRRFGF